MGREGHRGLLRQFKYHPALSQICSQHRRRRRRRGQQRIFRRNRLRDGASAILIGARVRQGASGALGLAAGLRLQCVRCSTGWQYTDQERATGPCFVRLNSGRTGLGQSRRTATTSWKMFAETCRHVNCLVLPFGTSASRSMMQSRSPTSSISDASRDAPISRRGRLRSARRRSRIGRGGLVGLTVGVGVCRKPPASPERHAAARAGESDQRPTACDCAGACICAILAAAASNFMPLTAW